MFNKILIYCAGMPEVSLLEKLVKENVPSALMVNFCRHSDKLKQSFYGYIDADPSSFKIWGCFNPEDIDVIEDEEGNKKITAEPIEVFDTRMSPNSPQVETYFAVGKEGEAKKFVDLEGKAYEVDECGYINFEDERLSVEDEARDFLVRTNKMLPDYVLMRTDGFMSWNNGELYVHDDDKSKEITQLCTQNNVHLIKYSVVEEEPEEDTYNEEGSFTMHFPETKIGNESELINQLKQIEETFKKNLP